MKKQTLAVLIGTGIFFPPEFSINARKEITEAVEKIGCEVLILPEKETTFGGINSNEDGRKYARFLEEHHGKFDGIVFSLPNFGNENSAILAVRDANVPIFVHAYSDTIGMMDPKHRRDAYCGKFSVMNQFVQARVPFTTYMPHSIMPDDPRFLQQLSDFAAVSRVVKGMKRFTVGSIGARTTPWKTVRFDEVTLENHGITNETVDMSILFERVRALPINTPAYAEKYKALANYADWSAMPSEKFDTFVKTGVVIDQIIEENDMDCVGFRCWHEIEDYLHIAPCVLLAHLNSRGIPAACEVDIGNAVSMRALQLATDNPAVTLDINNNYGDEEEKCILFHCGPMPVQMLREKQKIVVNPLLAMVHGDDDSWGSSQALVKPSPMTYMSAKSENGRMKFYLGDAEFTNDPIEEAFFGNAGVAKIPNLQKVMYGAGQAGFRHHVSVSLGHAASILREAFKYLDYDVVDFA